MGMMKEFREFATRGNVIDMAVGIALGTAFTAIVKSLVDNIIMPPIGLVVDGKEFGNLEWVLKEGTLDEAGNQVGHVAVGYGAFIQTIVNFLIIAFCLFLVVRTMNRLRRKKEEKAAPATPPKEEILLTEIRDELKRLNAQ